MVQRPKYSTCNQQVYQVLQLKHPVSMLLTTVLLMYIYTARWLNNYVVQLCPFWCNSYGARLSRLLTHPSLFLSYLQVPDSLGSGGPFWGFLFFLPV